MTSSTKWRPSNLRAFAFIDSPFGSTLAVSLGPNDAGIQWIDAVLDEQDGIAYVTAQTDEGLLHIAFDGDRFVLTVPDHDLTAHGEIGGREVTVINGGQTTVHAVDPEATRAYRAPGAAGPQPIGFTRTDRPRRDGLGPRQAENPLDYMVDRPVQITAAAVVEVLVEAEGASLEAIQSATGFGLYITQCAAAAPRGLATSVSCTPGLDDVSVYAQIRLRPPADWREAAFGVFASRERREAWVDHNSRHRTGYAVLSKTTVPLLGSLDWRVGLAAGFVTETMGLILGRTSSVPCGTITVAEELIASELDANESFTVNLGVSAVAWDYEFNTDTTQVRPFSVGEQTDGPLRLIGTPIEDDAPEGATPRPDGDTDADLDGVYIGPALAYEIEDGDGVVVVNDQMRLVIEDGTVVDFSVANAVNDAPTETGARERVLCRSDVAFEARLLESATLVEGVAEAAIEWAATQSLGRRTSEASESFECDADLEGRGVVELVARFTVSAEGTAVVEILVGGEALFVRTLTR